MLFRSGVLDLLYMHRTGGRQDLGQDVLKKIRGILGKGWYGLFSAFFGYFLSKSKLHISTAVYKTLHCKTIFFLRNAVTLYDEDTLFGSTMMQQVLSLLITEAPLFGVPCVNMHKLNTNGRHTEDFKGA